KSPTTVRTALSTVGRASLSASAFRTAVSSATASAYIVSGTGGGVVAASPGRSPKSTNAIARVCLNIAPVSTQLRVDLLEVPTVHEYLPRLSAGRRRHQTLGLHHVHQPRGTAESNPQPALQVGDRRLSALDDDARRFVVQVVFVHF